MDKRFWEQRWQNDQIGFHRGDVNPHLVAYVGRLGLGPGAKIFVPLCGKSVDMLWLQQQGYRVLGVEFSEIAVGSFFAESDLVPVKQTQSKFTAWRGGNIEILRGNAFDLGEEDLAGIDAVYDRAALIALPPALRRNYTRMLIEHIPKTAKMLMVSMEYPQSQMDGPPFSVHSEEIHGLFGDAFTIDPLLEQDILAENARFRDRGLTSLVEKVYILKR
ncbi:MAG TPA: thiopurine S-methyltransferase [Acidiferrobacteraceae bacterium]|nr:thiopurine S-methyltransferase [Acidiferrobacteraceae bacterium]